MPYLDSQHILCCIVLTGDGQIALARASDGQTIISCVIIQKREKIRSRYLDSTLLVATVQRGYWYPQDREASFTTAAHDGGNHLRSVHRRRCSGRRGNHEHYFRWWGKLGK